ncbi:serine acetyltransferase [Aquincola sp. S2]|uniref:Serine acetyltransferase n=1 Tax=Pseudaquabacterium terrae TaxID=2732868 RepID=A0ABX2EC32_9BURK|nr:serine acetyltransferase [Aquabacterium terrae]NRF65922.1 serine acetyltransferase [Aquabacterium terrae]
MNEALTTVDISRIHGLSTLLESEHEGLPAGAMSLTPSDVDELMRSLLDLSLPHRRARSFGTGASRRNSTATEGLTQALKLLSAGITSVLSLPVARQSNRSWRAEEVAMEFLEAIPRIRGLLIEDVRVTYERDPAAGSVWEVMLAYPGVIAVAAYRLAHALLALEVPVIPRMMSAWAHRATGIDIHPAAKIGERLAIDHGTGIVIGQTAVVGSNVSIYHGVTLGALSPRDDANSDCPHRRTKRHPTVEDDVVLYANATVLGGATVVGKGAVLGASVFVTRSVAPGAVIVANARGRSG